MLTIKRIETGGTNMNFTKPEDVIVDKTSEFRLFVDMDGTIASWQTAEYETLTKAGFFLYRPPMMNVITAINRLLQEREDISIYILSACMNDLAIQEKKQYVDRYLPFIDMQHRIFTPFGEDKIEYLLKLGFKLDNTDFLLDDYSFNLHQWVEAGGTGIKVRNFHNGNFGSWKGHSIDSRFNSPELIYTNLTETI